MAQTNNILLGSPGVASQTNTIMIGNSSTNACYVAGIYGNSIGTTNAPVLISNDNKLGTTGGSGNDIFGSLNFCAYLNSNVAGVTGDGTDYYLGSTTALTFQYNNSSGAFVLGTGAGTGTGNAAYFEAPVNGTYYFLFLMQLLIGSPANLPDGDCVCSIEVPGIGNYSSFFGAVGLGENIFLGDQVITVAAQIAMTATSKAYFSFLINRASPSRVDGVHGNSNPLVTYICGYRIT